MGKHFFAIIILIVMIIVCLLTWMDFRQSEWPAVPKIPKTGEPDRVTEPSVEHLPRKVSENYQRKAVFPSSESETKQPETHVRPSRPAQTGELERQSGASSGELADQAWKLLDSDPSLSLRLAEASLNQRWNRLAEKTVWKAMRYPLYNMLVGHDHDVVCAAFSPDGKQIATASRDRTVRIWNADGQTTKIFDHDDAMFGVAFSPDGKLIVTASKDGIARILDAETGEEQMVFKGHSFAVTHADFSLDGGRVATSSLDKTVRIWDAVKGETGIDKKTRLISILTHPDEVCDIDFSRNGKHVATASKDGIARIWNTDTQKIVATFKHDSGKGPGQTLWSVMFSADDARLVSASENRTARIWDCFNAGKPYLEVTHPTPDVLYTAAFSSDGTRIITGSKDKTAIVWDPKTGKEKCVLKGHDGAVLSASFSPNDKRKALTASKDKTARVWDLRMGRECHVDSKFGGAVLAVRFISNETTVSVSRDKTARIRSLDKDEPEKEIPLSFSFIDSAAISPNGGYAALLPGSNTVAIFSLASGKILHTLRGHTQDVTHAVFSEDGSMIATASKDGSVRIWDVLSGKQRHVLSGDGEHPIFQVAFSPSDNFVVLGSSDGGARIWDWEKNKTLPLGGHKGNVKTVAFSPDGERVVTSSDNGGVRIWAVKTGIILGERKEIAGHLLSMTFSPNGIYLVTASQDEAVSVWDAGTGEKVHVFTGHSAAVLDVSFSPDGKYMATASLDNTMRIRPFDSLEILRLVNNEKIRGTVRSLTEEEKYRNWEKEK